jgi:DNA repair ATPase RecN
MTPENKKTIQDRMKNKQAEAERRIKALLWEPTPDGEKIADVALMAGLSGERVAEMEAGVEDAKATLARIGEYNVPELKAAKDKAETAAKKTLAKLEAAHEAHAAAESSKQSAEADLEEALLAHSAAVGAIASGRIPPEHTPPELLAFVELGQARAVVEQIENEARQFHHATQKAHGELATMERRLQEVKALGNEMAITPGGLVDGAKQLEGRIERLRLDIATAEQHEKALAAKLAEATKTMGEARRRAGL